MVEQRIKDFVEKVFGKSPYEVGDIVEIDGRPARITSGQYWGTRGISNFWHWEFLDEGEPRTGCGYAP